VPTLKYWRFSLRNSPPSTPHLCRTSRFGIAERKPCQPKTFPLSITASVETSVSEHHEILQGMGDFVEKNLNLLTPPERSWQPSDYLPDLTAENWFDQVEEFRLQAEGISDDLLVVLVGDMVTEEALPSYSVSLNRIAKNDEGQGSPLGRLAARLDSGRKPPRRPAQRLPPPHRSRQYAGRREDDPSSHCKRIQSQDLPSPLQRLGLYLVSGTSHQNFPRQCRPVGVCTG